MHAAGAAPTAARPLLGLLAIALAVLAPAMDTSVNIAMPAITAAFGLAQRDIQWVVTCYMLAYGSLMLTCGKLGDLYGHRRVLRLGLATCAAAFAVCALATAFPALLAGRALQGIGIALAVSCAPALATALYPEARRTWVLGIYGTIFALGTALGPFLGSWLVSFMGWSGVFAFRVPVVLLALALSGALPASLAAANAAAAGAGLNTPATSPPSATARATAPFDWIGAGLLITWMSLLMLAFAGPHDAATRWPAWPAWLPDGIELGWWLGGLGLMLLVAFVAHENRYREPIIRPGLFRSERFATMNVLSLIAALATFSVMLHVPYFLVNAAALPIEIAGLILAMSGAGNMAGSSLTGHLAGRIRAARLAFTGLALAGLGLVLIGQWTATTPTWHLAACLLLQGLGMGLFQVAYNDSIIAALPIKDRGVAGSLTMMVRTLGILGGATGLSALLKVTTAGAVAAGAAGLGAFVAGFQQTLTIAGGGLLAVLALTLLRPQVWR